MHRFCESCQEDRSFYTETIGEEKITICDICGVYYTQRDEELHNLEHSVEYALMENPELIKGRVLQKINTTREIEDLLKMVNRISDDIEILITIAVIEGRSYVDVSSAGVSPDLILAHLSDASRLIKHKAVLGVGEDG